MRPGAARLANRIYHYTLDVVFPPRCAGCRTWSHALFCDACSTELKYIAPPCCARCGLPFDPLAQSAPCCASCRARDTAGASQVQAMRSVLRFEGPLRHAVHRFKYQDKPALAAPLAGLLHHYLGRQPANLPAIPLERLCLLVPVPLHGWRRYRRGYNQSALLAYELSKLIEVPCAAAPRHTTPQVELSARERARNVRGAFALDQAAWNQVASHHPSSPGGPVLLMDDVCTTGATLRECAGALAPAGVTEIYALTLARQL